MKSVDRLPSRYRIDSKLGEGGFGEVFKAYDSHLKQTLAIKILPDSSTAARDTLTSEFETLSRLQHINLVRVFDYGTLPPNTPYFTMELLEGKNLRDFLRDKANIFQLPVIVKQTLNALGYLNKNRILHGDIKPENIIITRNEDLGVCTKLLDFGLTSNVGDEKRLLSGTLRYLAPEILFHRSPSSPATDLYALGISLIESVLSEEVSNSNDINEAFFEKTYKDLNKALAGARIRNPSALSSFILDLCRLDTADRMRNAKEASRSFEMIATELSPDHEIQANRIFVGRNREIAEIDSLLTAAASSKKVIILSGLQGIGKKSILGKATQSAQVKGFLPIDLTPSSSYFSLAQLTGVLGSHLSIEDNERLLSKLPAWARDNDRRGSIDLNPGKASVIFAHIIDFLIEMSFSQHILIIVSDIEHGSKDFLMFMVQLLKLMETSNPNISLLMTLNAGGANQAGISEPLNRITMSPLSAVIEVQPFNDELLKQYLTACFGRTLLPEKERRDLISKTQGIPLLIASFLRNLVAVNVIQYKDGYWILDRKLYKQTRIPTDLDHSLAIALKDVSPEQLALLRLVALKGPISNSELALSAQGIIEDPEQELGGLLEKANLVNHNDGIVSFAHPFYSLFVIENTPANILRDYSGHLADRLVTAESIDTLRIAQLYASAERVDEAVEYGLDAVDRMYSSYLLYDCLKLLLDLKNLVLSKGSKSQLLTVLEKLAPIEHKTGLPKEAIHDYITLADSAQNDAQKVSYYMQLAEIHYYLLGDINDSRAMLQKALRSARRARQSDLLAAVYHGLAGLSPAKSILFLEKAAVLSKKTNVNLHLTSLAHLSYHYQVAGRPKKASMIQDTLIREMAKADLAARKEIYHDLYCLNFYNGDYRAAISYIKKKVQLEKMTEDVLELATSMSSLAGCFYTEGSFYKMISTLREAYEIALKYNKNVSAITILSNLSLGYRTVADYGLSLKMLLQAEELGIREGIQAWNSAFLNKPTMLYVMLGKAKEAEFKASARRLYERATKTKNHIGSGHHSMAFAIHHMNKLQPDDALIHAKKALSFFKQAADRDDVVSALAHIAIIQLSMGKPKQARTNLEQAEEIYQAIHCEYLKPLLMLTKAMLARLDHSDDAKKILADALRISKKMGTREITWQIQREYALFHKEQGEPHKALAYYKDAIETIKQITETIDEEELRLSYLQVPFRRRVFDEIKNLK